MDEKLKESIMNCHIDNKRQPESLFWNSLYGLASEKQKCELLEGHILIIGGVEYEIVLSEDDDNLNF